MKSYCESFGSSPLMTSAVKHAEELALKSGKPSVIYYRPIDGSWFVLHADSAAPSGRTIKTTVYPDQPNPDHPDIRTA